MSTDEILYGSKYKGENDPSFSMGFNYTCQVKTIAREQKEL